LTKDFALKSGSVAVGTLYLTTLSYDGTFIAYIKAVRAWDDTFIAAMRVGHAFVRSRGPCSLVGFMRRHWLARDCCDASAREENRTRTCRGVVDLVRDFVLAPGYNLILRGHGSLRRKGASVELGHSLRRYRALAYRTLVVRPVPSELSVGKQKLTSSSKSFNSLSTTTRVATG